MTAVAPNDASIKWEHHWDDARSRARNERKLLLIDVEKDD